jgi:6-phosphogluconolactonase
MHIPPLLYVGSGFYSEPSAIYSYRFDLRSGTLSPQGKPLTTPVAPTYGVIHPEGRLYAAIEKEPGEVLATRIHPSSGLLSTINLAPAGGAASTHIALDESGRFLFLSHYNSGNVSVLHLQAKGAVGKIVDQVEHGKQANAHGVAVFPGNRFVFVALKGSNAIAQYHFDASSGRLMSNDPPQISASGGPRHLAVHPTQPWLYAINELSSTVTHYWVDPQRGTLRRLGEWSTLPARTTIESTGAEIQLSSSGRFLYASNRGHNSIAVFRVDATSGALSLRDTSPTAGRTPRMFSLDPSGAFLLVANQDSDSIVGFKVNPKTGLLRPTGQPTSVPRPSWLGFSGPNPTTMDATVED